MNWHFLRVVNERKNVANSARREQNHHFDESVV